MLQKLFLLLFCLTSLALAETRPLRKTPAPTVPVKTQPIVYDNYSKAQLSLELGGTALLYSVYGSYRFLENWAVNVGASYVSINLTASSSGASSSASATLFQIPVSLSYLLGGPSNFFEVLAGVDLVMLKTTGIFDNFSGLFKTDESNATVPAFEVGLGYRYWPRDGGFHFRVMALLVVAKSAIPWGGLSFGYAF